MSNAAFKAALQRKPVDATLSDREIGRLKKAAARWLSRNDKPSARKKFVDAKRKERARTATRFYPLR